MGGHFDRVVAGNGGERQLCALGLGAGRQALKSERKMADRIVATVLAAGLLRQRQRPIGRGSLDEQIDRRTARGSYVDNDVIMAVARLAMHANYGKRVALALSGNCGESVAAAVLFGAQVLDTQVLAPQVLGTRVLAPQVLATQVLARQALSGRHAERGTARYPQLRLLDRRLFGAVAIEGKRKIGFHRYANIGADVIAELELKCGLFGILGGNDMQRQYDVIGISD